jgi:hypothetical protein
MARILRGLFIAGLVILVVRPGNGQSVSGTITGYVLDPSNNAVPSAKVTTTNAQTGVATTRTTDITGLFLISNLLPGTYTVTAEAAGFQRLAQENVVLRVDSKVNLELHLSIGALTQEVTVNAAPALLQSEKADVNIVLPEQQIRELPVVSRNITRLHLLAPGVSEFNFQQGPGENPSLGATVVTNGQFWGSNEYQIDGITDIEFGSTGMQMITPNMDSVQEMKITTSTYDAELGQVSGMVAQYVTKSGTNDIHGSAFWYNRNKATFAADPFAEKVPGTGPDGKGTGPAPFNFNQFGGSFGGPIIKNKMFIFGDYQGNRTRQGAAQLATVPPSDFQNGDLSRALGAQVLDASGNPIMVKTTEGGLVAARTGMVFDPLTGNPDGTGRSAFSCNGKLNVICANRFNPVSTSLLGLLNTSLAGHGFDSSKTDQNFVASGSQAFDQDQFVVRWDANLNDSNRIFVRYTKLAANLDNPAIFGLAGGPSVGGLNPERANYNNHHAVINFTHNFSPTLLMEARMGFARFGLEGYQYDIGHLTDDAVGIKGINSSDPLTQGLAGINVDGPVGKWFMGLPSGAGIPRIQFNTIFQWNANFTKNYSSHEFRFGLDARRQRFDFLTLNESSRGNFNFNQLITADANIPGTGLGMGTFLLGMPSGYDRASFSQFPGERNTRIAWYAQDAWRVTQKFSINYGLRWEYIGPSTPAHPGGGVNYDPASGNLLLSGLGQVSQSANVKPDYNVWGPRIGLAYKLTSKTVIRAGFGRSYFAGNYGATLGTMCCSYPVQTPQNVTQFNSFFPIKNPTTGNLYTLDQTVPPPPPLSYPPSGLLPLPPGTRPLFVPTDTKTSYTDTWNVTLQRELVRDMTVSVAYVGNVGRRIYGSMDINAPVPGPGDANLRRPYHVNPGVDVQIGERCHCQSSAYNALQVVLEKRFSAGYSIMSTYTWSKALDVEYGGFGWGGQAQNPYNIRASRGISEWNRASLWTVGHVWKLPFGKGQKFGENAPKAAQAVLGGWLFNGFTTVGSGFPVPINWGDASSLNNAGAFGQRPDVVGNPVISNPSRSLWYNPQAFANPTPYNFGNYGRDGGDLRGPSFFSADWSLGKEARFKTPLAREATTLEFRVEGYNLFNRTNLGSPNGTADSSTAGQIFAIQGTMRRLQFGLHLAW